jgi:hypothetical protein
MLIPSCNLSHLRDAIEAMNRRCRKLGQSEIRLTVGETVFEERRHETGVKYQFEMVNVDVVGESPVLKGWKLVGVVERIEEENMVRCVPGETVPSEYRFTDTHCDHCKTDRRRKEVFVLRHVDGRHVQVGRQCIADFLGHVSVEAMIARAEWEISAASELRDACGENYGRAEKIIPLDLFVTTTAIVIRRLGWVSRKMAEEALTETLTTAHLVWQVLTSNDKFTKELVESNELYVEPRDEELAAKSMAWAANLPTDEGDYLYNLGVACRCASVTYRTRGVVASVIAAYNKHVERVLESEKKTPCVHVGTVGKREEFAVSVKKMSYFDSQYGVKTLVRFETAGNVLIWWASGDTDWLHEGDELKIVGTVAKHDDYKGTPQTVLKRVRKA